MLLQTILFLLSTGLSSLWWIFKGKSSRPNQPSLPPGPPADPIIGHLRKLPNENSENYFYELSKDYGKVAHLSIFGRTMVILNSTKAAVDLLEKRGAIYSDRPKSPMMKLMGWIKNVAFMSYGKELRQHRRMLNEYLNQDKCVGYRIHQAAEAKRLIRNIVKTPEAFIDHLSRFSAAVILRIIHGQEIHSDDSPYIRLMQEANYCNANCAPPGSNSVDLFPILQYFPSWFPGTYPATLSRRFRPMVDELYNYPFEDVVRQMTNNTALDSFISSHLHELKKQGDQCPFGEMDIKGAAATSYSAGTDTTWATVLVFILCMVYYPDVQSQAQAELNRVLGNMPAGDWRLPTFEDRENLPYLESVVQESHRWYSVVPSGLPHRVTEDNIYEGMFIPKGATVIPNTRGMSLDEDVYKDAEIFDPSRYSRGEPYPVAQFGFGRRICPGRHLADASVWIVISYMLTLFDIKPAVNDSGEKIYPPIEFVSGLTSHPKFFNCSITPRNSHARGLVNEGN